MSITRQNLSVIIVSYKSEHVIENCIKSIDSEIEIIVIDNSGNDQLKEKIETKYKNVKCILSKENLGMGAGNNLGIKNVFSIFSYGNNTVQCLYLLHCLKGKGTELNILAMDGIIIWASCSAIYLYIQIKGEGLKLA